MEGAEKDKYIANAGVSRQGNRCGQPLDGPDVAAVHPIGPWSLGSSSSPLDPENFIAAVMQCAQRSGDEEGEEPAFRRWGEECRRRFLEHAFVQDRGRERKQT